MSTPMTFLAPQDCANFAPHISIRYSGRVQNAYLSHRSPIPRCTLRLKRERYETRFGAIGQVWGHEQTVVWNNIWVLVSPDSAYKTSSMYTHGSYRVLELPETSKETLLSDSTSTRSRFNQGWKRLGVLDVDVLKDVFCWWLTQDTHIGDWRGIEHSSNIFRHILYPMNQTTSGNKQTFQ